VRFVVDAQLPTALTLAIKSCGHVAESVRDLGLGEAEDDAIWDFAIQNGASIITKDEDFATRLWRTNSGPPIVWAASRKLFE
jgi:predicted nuclease of predicted toxin-antitoxin system